MFKVKENTRVFVCPTDTVYGLSARADDEEAIERIKVLKGRGDTRFIILIADINNLSNFGIKITERQKQFLKQVWPGTVTVAFDDERAFRLPDYAELTDFIKEFGPIVSTSANRHGQAEVKTVEEARDVFGEGVDEYIDGGELNGEPSTIVKIVR